MIGIGIVLVEDVAVVAMTVLMPALGEFDSGRLLLIGQALAKAVLILVPLGHLSAKVIPHILTHVARTQNQELFLLVTLAISLGHCCRHAGGRIVPRVGSLLGRPYHQRIGICARNVGPIAYVETSATLIRHALAWFGIPKDRVLDYVEQYRQSMEAKRPPK